MDTAELHNIAKRKKMASDDVEKLRKIVNEENRKIIKLRVDQETAYWDVKEKLRQTETNHEKLQQNMAELHMKYETVSGKYQEELRFRPETLNKLASTRAICDVLEDYSERLRDTLSRCKGDQVTLTGAYHTSGQVVRDLKDKQMHANEYSRLVVDNLQEKSMKGPSRPAPSVPKLGVNRYSPVTNWNDDPFGADVFEPTPNTMHKKKPPPRPPPPKIKQPDVPAKPSHFIRRPTVLSSLLSRNKNYRNTPTNKNVNSTMVQNTLMDLKLEDTQKMFPKCEVKPVATGALIDLSSPPSSPTFTTRSSSDGLSVDSFGSDATTSTNHHHLPGSSASQAESGFEDDFDIFLTSRKIPKDNTLDDFASVDPFCSPPVAKLPVVKKPSLSRDIYDMSSNMSSAPAPLLQGPTIIRAKPARPKPPDNTALLKTTFGGTFPVTSMNVNTSTTPIQKVCNGLATADSFDSNPCGWAESSPPRVDWDDYDEDSPTSSSRESSPPMPSVPPPPPPPDAAGDWPVDPADLADSLSALQHDQNDQPYAIALFDYNTGHPDDLQFSVNDKIELVRRVDDEWLCGRLRGGAEGLFPANHVEIKMPLPMESLVRVPSLGTATALFALTPVEPTDLRLRVGDTITMLQRLSDDWYFGECHGRKGHFPANYVQMH